jgi:hypothetical protein
MQNSKERFLIRQVYFVRDASATLRVGVRPRGDPLTTSRPMCHARAHLEISTKETSMPKPEWGTKRT